MPNTWVRYAREILGYVPERTYINERYVVVKKVEKWLKAGYTPYEIGLIWNGGEPREKRGVNEHGIPYDTAAYARIVLATYKKN